MARNLSLGFHHLGAHLLDGGDHFLLVGDGHGAALLRLGLRDAVVGLGLIGLQLRADVAPHVHIRDVDGENSKAVPASRPLAKTVREIRSGFSSTALWLSAEPTVVTMPSPTRAMMVSSPAPPTRRSMLARR